MFNKTANIFKRIIAGLIDQILIYGFMLMVYSKLLHLNVNDIKINNQQLIYFFVFSFLYFFISEYFFQKTIGKKILNLKVIEENKSKLSFKSSFIRNLIRPIDSIGLYLFGLIFISLTKKSQRLGDLAAKTQVVENIW